MKKKVMISEDMISELAGAALNERKHSYAPYSHFAVGAALLTKDGKLYKGCNVENAAYPVCLCAERNAISTAIADGKTKFKALLIAGGPADSKGCDFCAPCGMCRQFIREFCDESFPIITIKTNKSGKLIESRIYTLAELLPDSFGPENLG